MRDYLDDNEDSFYFEEEEQQKTKRHKPYVKNSELYAELEKWRDSSPDIEKRIPSEKLGEMILKIATNYMNHPNYVRYSDSIKEEIISESCEACLAALNCFKFEYKNPFAYFTQVCWSCAMEYLAKHYKDLNFKRDLMKKSITQMIESGINTQSAEFYLKMLNDFTCELKHNEELKEENEEFIKNLMNNHCPQQVSDDE